MVNEESLWDIQFFEFFPIGARGPYEVGARVSYNKNILLLIKLGYVGIGGHWA